MNLETDAHCARGIDLEEVPGALVEIRVERPHEPVVGPEGAVANHLVAQEPRRLRVEALHAQVESIAIEGDADLGAFGRRRAVLRVELREVGRRPGALPDHFLEPAVNGDALLVRQLNRRDARTRIDLLRGGDADDERHGRE